MVVKACSIARELNAIGASIDELVTVLALDVQLIVSCMVCHRIHGYKDACASTILCSIHKVYS